MPPRARKVSSSSGAFSGGLLSFPGEAFVCAVTFGGASAKGNCEGSSSNWARARDPEAV